MNQKIPTIPNHPCPEGLKFRPYQLQGIAWCISRRASMIGDEMGLGKTIQAIGIINQLKAKKVLIVTTASTRYHWAQKLKEWLTVPRETYVIENSNTYIPTRLASIIIVNYDLLIKPDIFRQLIHQKFALGIYDEAHYLKNFNAQRTKRVLSKDGLVHRCVYNVAMTGTPVLNRPIELYPILKVMSPKTLGHYSSYYSYARRFCGAFEQDGRLNVRGASNLDDLNRRLTSSFMIRRLEKDVEGQLPAKSTQLIPLKMNPETFQVYQKVTEARFDEVKKKKLKLEITEMTALRQELALAKTDLCLEHIRSTLEQVPKLVVFAYHRAVIQRLACALVSDGPVVLMGGMTNKAKFEAIEKFKAPGTTHRVFIGQIQAAGQGIDGLQYGTHIIDFVEWSWVPGEITQAIKRVHRWGQCKKVLARFYVIRDSLEENMLKTALDKKKIVERILQ